MAGFIQNYVGGIVQNAALGAATYAITTGGRVVGDAVIGAGDLIEGAGRNVGNSVEGYIDRYGNWVRGYGNGVISATAASSAPAGSVPVKATKKAAGTTTKKTQPKALPGVNKPGTKALPAPPAKTGVGKPGLKRSVSDSKAPLTSAAAGAGGKALALPTSGVKKALPAVGGVAGGVTNVAGTATRGLSKGQLAKRRNLRAGDKEKEKDGEKKTAIGLPAPPNPVTVGGANKKKSGKSGYAAASVAGSDVSTSTTPTKKTATNGVGGGGAKAPYAAASVAGKNDGVPSSRNPAGGAAGGGGGAKKTPGEAYPKPFSTTRPDGKVVISAASRPNKTTAAGGAAPGNKAAAGGGGGSYGGVGGKLSYDSPDKKEGAKAGAKTGGSEKGGFDFMRLMAEEPKKKGPGSVAGSVRSTATKKAGGGGTQETSGKYDFF